MGLSQLPRAVFPKAAAKRQLDYFVKCSAFHLELARHFRIVKDSFTWWDFRSK